VKITNTLNRLYHYTITKNIILSLKIKSVKTLGLRRFNFSFGFVYTKKVKEVLNK